jgi:G6PDH family F420-dependent oxidoreductase
MRIHPAIVAQAAATSAAMLPGRFFLGVGSGENLNEHIVARGYPAAATRLEMLEEAIQLIRSLWEGKLVSHRGTHFEVENARLYSLPEEPPPVYVAGHRLPVGVAGRPRRRRADRRRAQRGIRPGLSRRRRQRSSIRAAARLLGRA